LPKQYSWNKEKGGVVKKVSSVQKIEKEENKQIKKSDISSLAKKLKNEQK